MYSFFKFIIDELFAFILLIVLLPLLIMIALIIKISSPGPIIIKQKRFGKKKKIFIIYKFRTLKIEAPSDVPTHLLEHYKKYTTKFGKVIRRLSLDELPQLMNILFGQMSFIGPRPALWNQCDLIKERDKYKANDIRPGLTGWAQINGRNRISIEQKAFLDGEYTNKISLLFDIKIFCLTFLNIFTETDQVEKNSNKVNSKEKDN
jgi:O-antigen biosynthesis protein WbqP